MLVGSGVCVKLWKIKLSSSFIYLFESENNFLSSTSTNSRFLIVYAFSMKTECCFGKVILKMICVHTIFVFDF